MPRSLYAPLVFVSLCLAGCAVGPDFKRPDAPQTTAYDATPLPGKTASVPGNQHGAAQTFINGQDIPATWWELFHSEPLNQLIEEAIKNNPDLEAAKASLEAAEEDTAAEESVLFPEIDASFSTTRQKVSSASNGGKFPGSLYTLHNASVSMTYGFDLWGGARRSLEQLEAEEDYERFQLEAAYLSLTANVVTAAIQEASLRDQIDATHKIIDDETKERDLLQQQLDLGGIAKSALLTQSANLAAAEARLPPLEKQLALTRHEISVLVGKFSPDEPRATFELASLTLPEELPLTLPSKLVEQRPDVRAAEANLHAASAAVGVAEALRLPSLTLSGNIGDAANNLGKMFSPGSGLWSMGFDLAEPIFDAGKLAHQEGAAEAKYLLSMATYRKTVLTAFQNVADSLRALQYDATTLAAQVTAEQAAHDSLLLAEEQYAAGSISYLNLLTAEQAEAEAMRTLIPAEAARYADTAALFQALGGGWWNRTEDLMQNRDAAAADQGMMGKLTNFNKLFTPSPDGRAHD